VTVSGGVITFSRARRNTEDHHDSEFDAVIRSCATRLSKRFVSMHATSFSFLSLAISQSAEPIAEGGMHRRSLSSLFTRVSDGPTWTSSAI
jgi:hypothetical protein